MRMKYVVDLNILKSEIERKGIQSVEELSRKSRINESQLMRVLNGKQMPAMDEMVELVSVLDLSPEKAKEIFFKSIMRDTYKKEGKYGEGKSNC
ncbi:XRE family transcriptional regulator [Eisenbergiella sp. OF01-20]|jgi:transcriptional regulator with XRE-family HTH domain|nr:XRE family transcriptional regulator [Eisenbergiella sp. OF01-20]BDF47810.1 hypothetical protein CE91St56_49330 [Lachnospiraceae bacterium]